MDPDLAGELFDAQEFLLRYVLPLLLDCRLNFFSRELTLSVQLIEGMVKYQAGLVAFGDGYLSCPDDLTYQTDLGLLFQSRQGKADLHRGIDPKADHGLNFCPPGADVQNNLQRWLKYRSCGCH